MKELKMKKAFVCYYDAIMLIYKSQKPKKREHFLFDQLLLEYKYIKIKRLEKQLEFLVKLFRLSRGK